MIVRNRGVLLADANVLAYGPPAVSYTHLTAVVVKYLIRGDLGFVAHWLQELSLLALHVESQLAGQPWRYQRDRIRRLPPAITVEALAAAMTDLCGQVEGLMGVVGRMGITLRPAPRQAIEALMRLRPQY